MFMATAPSFARVRQCILTRGVKMATTFTGGGALTDPFRENARGAKQQAGVGGATFVRALVIVG